jgi:aldose 1-epimerase
VRAREAPCGRAPDGSPVLRVTLEGEGGARVELLSFGATLARWLAPDRRGVPGDIVLGFDELAGYTGVHPHVGSTIGRYANRIANARFPLHGRVHRLSANEPPHHLHGGAQGFDRRVWSARSFESPGAAGVAFALHSPDGDQGYPGALDAEARYTLAEDGALHAEFTARCDAATVVSLTQHAYFNLADGGAGDVLAHELEIAADAYLPVGRDGIPTGEIASVEGSALDFRAATPLCEALLRAPGGLDHNLVLRGGGGPAARLHDPASGRTLELTTSAPGLQLYTGNGLDGTQRGRGGVAWRRHAGVCLEPQRFPDAPNQPAFGSVVLEPGARYVERSMFRCFVA